MPQVNPIEAVTFAAAASTSGGPADISVQIAPPYDVLDEGPKQALLKRSPTNIVKIDLPFTPPKTVAPDPVYKEAGRTYRQWMSDGVLVQSREPAVFVYQQTYTHGGRTHARRGLIANVTVQDFGPGREIGGRRVGGVFAHEKTIAGGREDRLKLMRATRSQLSPIFGLYSDPHNTVGPLLERFVNSRPASYFGVTTNDNVRHDVWRITAPDEIDALVRPLSAFDLFIADGHHRYNTAINYHKENPDTPRAAACMFVLVSMQDPGMIVLPTHRVICGLRDFSIDKLTQALGPNFRLTPATASSLEALEASLPGAGLHAMGLYDPTTRRCFVLTTTEADPLASILPERARVWRELDVAVLHELVLDRVLKPAFGGDAVTFKYTAELSEMQRLADAEPSRLGIVVQPTPVEAVRRVSEAGELMPPKSTFFYPKLATGLVINPLE